MATWSNWSGLATAHPAQELTPHDSGDVVEAVVTARDQNLTVKMTGSGHSFTDIAVTDGILLRPDGLRGIVGVDHDAMTVTALAGTPLHELNRALERLDLSLHNLGRHRGADPRRCDLHRHPRHRRSPGVAQRPGDRPGAGHRRGRRAQCERRGEPRRPRGRPARPRRPRDPDVGHFARRAAVHPGGGRGADALGSRRWPTSTSWSGPTSTSRCTGSRTPTGC